MPWSIHEGNTDWMEFVAPRGCSAPHGDVKLFPEASKSRGKKIQLGKRIFLGELQSPKF